MAYEGQKIFVAPGPSLPDARKESLTFEEAKIRFVKFIREWSNGNSFIYRDQLRANARKGDYTLIIDLEDINAFDDQLVDSIRSQPATFLPKYESALTECYQEILKAQGEPVVDINFQIQLATNEKPKMLRDIQSTLINQLVVIPGIVTAASRPLLKIKNLVAKCSKCGNIKSSILPPGLGGVDLPRICDNSKKEGCPMDSYVILAEQCTSINVQTLRIQENPEQIPTGEVPRTYIVSCDRNLVDKVQAGSRVKIIGILSIVNKKDSLKGSSSKDASSRMTYLRAIGMQKEQAGGKIEHLLSPEDEGIILKMSRDPDIRKKINKSIASAIYGSPDIKEAIACLMFGGSPKCLPDRTHLRGDINILLLGDPSTAKSQFLKFVERAAPIAVYTSGKGSSAAGLTATIIKDSSSGEFQLEGGAMVLADGGVVWLCKVFHITKENSIYKNQLKIY